MPSRAHDSHYEGVEYVGLDTADISSYSRVIDYPIDLAHGREYNMDYINIDIALFGISRIYYNYLSPHFGMVKFTVMNVRMEVSGDVRVWVEVKDGMSLNVQYYHNDNNGLVTIEDDQFIIGGAPSVVTIQNGDADIFIKNAHNLSLIARPTACNFRYAHKNVAIHAPGARILEGVRNEGNFGLRVAAMFFQGRYKCNIKWYRTGSAVGYHYVEMTYEPEKTIHK